MSHVASVEITIKDLVALKAAAADCKLVLMEGQTTFSSWYGANTSGYGKCEHALRLADHKTTDYEIGLTRNADGQSYKLVFDSWGVSGQRIEAVAGRGLATLKTRYGVQVAKRQLTRQGYRVAERQDAQGRTQLVANKA